MPAEGVVDAVVGRFVVGWAHDRSAGERRVEVEVELDGEVVGSAIADLERSDLASAQIGDGRHAFRVELPAPLGPGTAHSLIVRATPEAVPLSFANDFSVQLDGSLSGFPPVINPGLLGDPAPAGIDGDAPPASAEPEALLGARAWLFPVEDRDTWYRRLEQGPVDSEIDRLRTQITADAARLHEKGITYVPAVLPDKRALYVDLLPADARPAFSSRVVERVIERLHEDRYASLLDLLAPLRSARRECQVVPRTGTGLTWPGALHAYRAVAKELAKRFSEIEPLTEGVLRFDTELPLPAERSLSGRPVVVLLGGDLMRISVGEDPPETEPELALAGRRAVHAPLPTSIRDRLDSRSTMLEHPDPDVRAALLVVHSGAGARVASLLAEHFSQTVVTVSDDLPWDAIAHESPTAVVHLLEEA